ncbi:MAG: PIG-L deacetylase family protein [Phototrophicaceae bacterium]
MLLFLSPHYDDAIYSCGGAIYHRVKGGESVCILTVMGGEPMRLPSTPLVAELHARWDAGKSPVIVRRAEDAVAAVLLGATADYWQLPDCIYRTDADGNALYPTGDHLWNTIHPNDPALAWLRQQPLPNGITEIYAPLGVGGHVDHLIVRAWALELAARFNISLWLYEEYPYRTQLEKRKLAYEQVAKLALNPVRFQLTDAGVRAKIEGVKAYRSQVSTFWADVPSLERDVLAAMQPTPSDRPFEMFFRLQASGQQG